ncbi:universal stress protein [Aldersonia kunmingensis]|uniref:universal stress protein n=1 Tax=Aldersonia kunmingensis TaxID=408066 RepID=UPI000829BF40|nr:universal stress protein [Aldersonia kunmingensis]
MNANEDQLGVHRLASAQVVVGTDGSEGAARAVQWAARLGAQRGRRLLIVHGYDMESTRSVRNTFDALNPAVREGLHARGEVLVADARRTAEDTHPNLSVSTTVSPENPGRLLIEYSRSAHVVVLGPTGRRGAIGHVGSTLLAVTSHGDGAIVVVRGTDGETRSAQPVLVGVDGSPVSDVAVGAAFREAAERRTGLVALHCWADLDEAIFYGAGIIAPAGRDADTEEALLAEQLAGWHEEYPDVVVARKIEVSAPAKKLIQYSKSAQLVVVGSRGRGGFRGLLLGSTSNSLVQHAHCPIMVVHPD